MALLLPFQALRYAGQPPTLFIPGEDPQPAFDPEMLILDEAPALFIHRQSFGDSTRIGIMGLLNRAEATVLPHEQVLPERVEGCRTQALESSSLFLWCGETFTIQTEGPPLIEATDRSDCTHTIWRVDDPDHIACLQAAPGNQPLFIADGHHRNAARWSLATIQPRTPALRTLAAHRLVFEDIPLPPTQPINDLNAYWAATPPGFVRFGVATAGRPLHGLELPHIKSERNVAVLNRLVLGGHIMQPIRTVEAAIAAVSGGHAKMAFLLEPLSVDKIEADARKGALLPPKSTDFYPKLAGGLVMHRR